MKKTKKFLALVMSAALVISVVGCSSSSTGSSTNNASSDSSVSSDSSTETEAGSGSSASSDEVIELSFWHCMGGLNGTNLDYLVEQFNDSHPNIHVTTVYQGEYADELTKYGAALQSGDLPDVMQLHEQGMQFMIDSGSYVPVQHFIDTVGLDENLLEAATSYYVYEDQQISLPFNTSTCLLWYNGDAFRTAGLDPDNPPTTFDEVIDCAQAIVESGACEYGFAAAIYGWTVESMIASLGCNYGNNNNGRTGRITAVEFDENGSYRKALETWMKWMDSGYCVNLGQTSNVTASAFMGGQVGMIVATSGALYNLIDSDFEVRAAYFPKIEDNPDGGVPLGGASLYIIDSGDEAREEAAYELITFLTNPESQAYWSIASGYLPINKDALETDTFQEYIEDTPVALVSYNQLNDTPDNYATRGCLIGVSTEARQIMQNDMESVINGEMSIDDAVTHTSEAINEAIAAYNANN